MVESALDVSHDSPGGSSSARADSADPIARPSRDSADSMESGKAAAGGVAAHV